MNKDNARANSSAQSGLGEALKSTADAMENIAGGASQQWTRNFEETRAKLQEMQMAVADAARHAAQDADIFVHENPWKSVGMAALAGLVIGIILNRR